MLKIKYLMKFLILRSSFNVGIAWTPKSIRVIINSFVSHNALVSFSIVLSSSQWIRIGAHFRMQFHSCSLLNSAIYISLGKVIPLMRTIFFCVASPLYCISRHVQAFSVKWTLFNIYVNFKCICFCRSKWMEIVNVLRLWVEAKTNSNCKINNTKRTRKDEMLNRNFDDDKSKSVAQAINRQHIPHTIASYNIQTRVRQNEKRKLNGNFLLRIRKVLHVVCVCVCQLSNTRLPVFCCHSLLSRKTGNGTKYQNSNVHKAYFPAFPFTLVVSYRLIVTALIRILNPANTQNTQQYSIWDATTFYI